MLCRLFAHDVFSVRDSINHAGENAFYIGRFTSVAIVAVACDVKSNSVKPLTFSQDKKRGEFEVQLTFYTGQPVQMTFHLLLNRLINKRVI